MEEEELEEVELEDVDDAEQEPDVSDTVAEQEEDDEAVIDDDAVNSLTLLQPENIRSGMRLVSSKINE